MDIFNGLPYDKDRSVTECYFGNVQKFKTNCDDYISNDSQRNTATFEDKSNTLIKNQQNPNEKDKGSIDEFVKIAFNFSSGYSGQNNSLQCLKAAPFENIYDEKQPFDDNDSMLSASSPQGNEVTYNISNTALHDDSKKMKSVRASTEANDFDRRAVLEPNKMGIYVLKDKYKIDTKQTETIPNSIVDNLSLQEDRDPQCMRDNNICLNRDEELNNNILNSKNQPMIHQVISKTSYDNEVKPSMLNRRRSTIGVNLHNSNYESMPAFSNKSSLSLNKNKSTSLYSLISNPNKKIDYGHVESKVKQYIKNIKEINRKNKIARSLPTTPSKPNNQPMTNDFNGLFISTENEIKNDEDMKNLIFNNWSNPDISKPLIESLFQALKSEKKLSNDQNLILKALQTNYEDLLAKYAQAENEIDRFKIYKGTQATDHYYTSSRNSIESSQSGFSRFVGNVNTPLKKALSTSNIYLDCSFSNNSNLMKYPSSPNIDDICEQMEVKCHEPKNLKLSRSRNNNENLPGSNICMPDHVDKNHIFEWLRKSEDLARKIKDYALLEGNSAINADERRVIWAHIQENFKALNNSLPSDFCTSIMKEQLHQIEKYLKKLLLKYHQPAQTSSPLEEPSSSVENDNNSFMQQGVASSLGHDDSDINFATKTLFPPGAQFGFETSRDDAPKQRTLNSSEIGIDASLCGKTRQIHYPKCDNNMVLEPQVAKYKIGFPGSEYYLSLSKRPYNKDNDSGYLASDRSTKNSHCPSLHSDQHFVNRPTLISSKDNISKHIQESSLPTRRAFVKTSDADYDSTSSSDCAASNQRSKRLTKKRNGHQKNYDTKIFESRFPKLSRNVDDVGDVSYRRRSCFAFGAKDLEPSISQFEKHSSAFKAQMKDRKINRLQHSATPNAAARHRNPVKPMTPHIEWKSFHERIEENQHCTSDHEGSVRNRNLSPEVRERFVPHYSRRRERKQLPSDSLQEDETPLVKQFRSKIHKAMSLSELPTESCFRQPLIYIKEYNCTSPLSPCFCEGIIDGRHSLVCRAHAASFKTVDPMMSEPDCLHFLNESTILAQHLKHRSQSMMNVLKK